MANQINARNQNDGINKIDERKIKLDARNQNHGINKIEEWKIKSMHGIKMMKSTKLKNGKANQCKKSK